MEKNSYLKDKFREDVFKEIENYIGYVYADDYHSCDKLIVNPFDMSVSHGVRIENSTQVKMDYFDTFGLIKRSGTFTFEPDPIGIECVVQHYYPDERVTKLVEKMKAVISEFIGKHGYNGYAKLVIPLGTFEPLVDSIDLKTKGGLVKVTEDEYGCDGYVERELRFLTRRNRQGVYTFQDDKLMRLAAELLLNYGLGNKHDEQVK